ncbi:MAG: glycosyltransferase family 4 protein [Prevotellaceae bacterium]|nr:glycosyltransferase family 4 protein [Candidatus Colivivens equi]
MKELYILDSSYNPTSAGCNRLLAFGLALQKKGVKVTYFYLFPYKNKEKCERYKDELCFVYLWENSPFSNKYLNTVRSMRMFYEIMSPEIPVYAYSLLNCIYFLRLKKGIRLYHEYTENPVVVGKIGGFVGEWLYRLYKRTIPRLDGLFLITPALRDMYIEEFGADPNKTFLLNMIVDRRRFEDLPELEPSATITYCGILSEFKDGLSVLIKAFAMVNEKHSKYKLRLVGPFLDDVTEQKLRSLVRELNILEQVEFTGSVSPENMPSLLKASKILALARPDNIQAKYGFATKIGEYLMTERPVVLTRVGAIEDYLVDRDNCIIVNPDDVCDFADKLIWTIDNYDEAIKIGKRGREAVIKYFDSENEAEKIYKLIFE